MGSERNELKETELDLTLKACVITGVVVTCVMFCAAFSITLGGVL